MQNKPQDLVTMDQTDLEADGDRLRCRAVNACIQFVPALDGNINGWIATLRLLEKHPAARIVPGHGPAFVPSDQTPR